MNLDSVNYLFTNDNHKQDIYNEMVSWFYHFGGTDDRTSSNDRKCKFKVFDQRNNDPDIETKVQALCNKVRGHECDWHNKNVM